MRANKYRDIVFTNTRIYFPIYFTFNRYSLAIEHFVQTYITFICELSHDELSILAHENIYETNSACITK